MTREKIEKSIEVPTDIVGSLLSKTGKDGKHSSITIANLIQKLTHTVISKVVVSGSKYVRKHRILEKPKVDDKKKEKEIKPAVTGRRRRALSDEEDNEEEDDDDDEEEEEEQEQEQVEQEVPESKVEEVVVEPTEPQFVTFRVISYAEENIDCALKIIERFIKGSL